MRSRTSGPFTIYMEMEPNNTRPLHVWASQGIKRRGKDVVPMGPPQKPENYLVKISYCPKNKDLWTAMTLKAWEEDLYDEGNIHAPWYPLIGDVVQRFMEFKNNCLTFIEGEEPKLENMERESVQYAFQLFKETQSNILEDSDVTKLSSNQLKTLHSGG